MNFLNTSRYRSVASDHNRHCYQPIELSALKCRSRHPQHTLQGIFVDPSESLSNLLLRSSIVDFSGFCHSRFNSGCVEAAFLISCMEPHQRNTPSMFSVGSRAIATFCRAKFRIDMTLHRVDPTESGCCPCCNQKIQIKVNEQRDESTFYRVVGQSVIWPSISISSSTAAITPLHGEMGLTAEILHLLGTLVHLLGKMRS